MQLALITHMSIREVKIMAKKYTILLVMEGISILDTEVGTRKPVVVDAPQKGKEV